MTTTISVTSPRWLDALCAQADPETWFPEPGANAYTTRYAKKVCARCAIRPECLAWAIDTRQRHGIWGGTTPEERKAMRTNRSGGDDQ